MINKNGYYFSSEGVERPWSAAEPRWNADRMFHSKQKGWEGLARNLHKFLI